MEYVRTTYQAIHDIKNAPELKVDVSNVDKNFNIFLTDLYNGLEDVDRTPGPPATVVAHQSENIIEYFKKLNQMFDFRPWILLTFLGILTSITGVVVDFLIVYVLNARYAFVKDEASPYLAFVVFWITGFVMISLAASIGVYCSPLADGSGVPELKSILSGANTYKYLDFKIFFPKIIGMTAAYGAGLSVGKVGPLIHLSAIIANALLKRPQFRHLDKNFAMKRSILSAAVGCGVAVALGTPIGGLIYSVEIFIGYFNVTNVFRSFYALFWCSVTMKFLKYFILIDPLVFTEFPNYDLDFDILLFVGLGIFIGLLTVSFLKMSIKLIYLRRTLKYAIFERFPFVWLSYSIVAIISFPLGFFSQSSRLLQNDAFSIRELSQNPKLGDNPVLTLTLYIIIKWISISLTFACNIPFGIFGPPLDIGAVAGRWFIEVVSLTGLINPSVKGAYGVASSAACVSCVVRAIAPVAILVEMTGQIAYALPITVSVLMSYMLGNAFSMSFFDVSIYLRKLPLMSSLMNQEKYERIAVEFISGNYPVLHFNCKHRDIFDLFDQMGEINKALLLPVVNEEGILVGAVKIENLLKYLEVEEQEEVQKAVQAIQVLQRAPSGNIGVDTSQWNKLDNFFKKAGSAYEKEINLEGDSRVVKPSFHMKTFKTNQDEQNEDRSQDPVERFWDMQLNWRHELMKYDPSPLTVTRECYASKLQFLFSVTRATCIFVTEAGKLIGCITAADFLKQKS